MLYFTISVFFSLIVSETDEPKKGMLKEFMDFLQKFGVIGLAIAFIIGQAASKLVTALVTDIVSPLIGLAMPNTTDLKSLSFTVGQSTFSYGDLITNIIDFLVIAFVVFVLYKQLSKFKLVEDKTK